jgi:hypothetical protein
MIKLTHNDDGSVSVRIDSGSLPVIILIENEPILSAHRITEAGMTHETISPSLVWRVLECAPEQEVSRQTLCQCRNSDDRQ